MNFLAIQVTEIFDLNGKPQKGKILTFFILFILFTLFLFFLNIGVRCPSHNWSKISSNQADFLRAHRKVNRVPGDPQWLHSVKGFRSYETPKRENIFKISHAIQGTF